ncbi:exonuclease domain-containing protein [Acidobacteriota bacterium]
MRQTDFNKAVSWTRGLLKRNDWVILDTETTGLGETDEIVQIAILSFDGTVLLDTLVRPTQPIPASATAIHNITKSDVANAPVFSAIYENIKSILAGKTVIIYNATYDVRLLRQTLSLYNLPPFGFEDEKAECAMLQYSAWKGELWSEGGYRWQKLPGGDHTALGDSQATLRIIRRMAESPI